MTSLASIETGANGMAIDPTTGTIVGSAGGEHCAHFWGNQSPQQWAPHRCGVTYYGALCEPIPGTGSVMGDPHVQTWSGDWYDFHGQCDLVYIDDPSFGGEDALGLTVHIRTSPRYAYSYIETAAIRIGDDILEISSWGEHFFNGVEMDAQKAFADLIEIVLAGRYKVTHTLVDEKKHIFEVDLLEGQKIVVTTFKDMVSVTVENARYNDFHSSTGLLGAFGTGQRLGRDGTTVLEDADAFGQEWQVHDDEPMLFQTERHPQYPVQCIMPDAKKLESRRLGQSIAEDKARAACAHWKRMQEQCIYDVMVSGDLELAEAAPGAYEGANR